MFDIANKMISIYKLSLITTVMVSVIWIRRCQATIQTYSMVQKTNLNNVVTSTWMYNEFSMSKDPSSVIECAVKCAQDERCVIFMVNVNTNKCRLHATRVTNSDQLENAQGFLMFETPRAADFPIGQQCRSTSQCTKAHTQCIHSICQCEAGYSFSPRRQACVSECAKYGTDFVGFEDYFITGLNSLILEDEDSLCPGCCLQRCIQQTSFVCRTVELLPGACYMSTATKFTVPSKYLYDTNKVHDVVHYQRQCSHDD